MSGGGGGGIIIRRKIKETASTAAVLEHVHPAKRARLEEILAVDEANWSDEEFHFVVRRISEAHDEQC